jgi:hypothetical protein
MATYRSRLTREHRSAWDSVVSLGGLEVPGLLQLQLAELEPPGSPLPEQPAVTQRLSTCRHDASRLLPRKNLKVKKKCLSVPEMPISEVHLKG